MQLARDAVATSPDNMQVIYGANENYVLPALVSIWSMWQNASQPVEVTLYVENMQRHSLDLIELARDRLGVPVRGKDFDGAGFEEYASQAMAYPVVSLLPLLLPRLVEGRCLFIDVDTLVMGDIWELVSADLNGMPIGACVDIGQVLMEDRICKVKVSDLIHPSRAKLKRKTYIDRIRNLGFVPGENYFNSGVLIMDCGVIRDQYPDWESLTNMDKLRPYTSMPDQDRLNEFFAGRWFKLPLEWNVRTGLKRHFERNQYKYRDVSEDLRVQIQEAIQDPKLWHFMGKRKPWLRRYRNSLRLRSRQGFKDYARVFSEFNAILGGVKE
ncbi:MAG: hypothetical protein F4201_00525 [Nitrospira sp. SB0677_bin_15]|nr:hypothetical protein [Nitrospira sp. SB0677_bin_15]